MCRRSLYETVVVSLVEPRGEDLRGVVEGRVRLVFGDRNVPDGRDRGIGSGDGDRENEDDVGVTGGTTRSLYSPRKGTVPET